VTTWQVRMGVWVIRGGGLWLLGLLLVAAAGPDLPWLLMPVVALSAVTDWQHGIRPLHRVHTPTFHPEQLRP